MPTLKRAEAFKILGLEGCSVDTVKATYKQIALRTHPDKNPDNPDATAEFQRVSEAYNVLLKHLDTSTRPSTGSGFPFEESDYEYDDDDYDDEDENEYYEANMPFYLYLFEKMMGGGNVYIVTRDPPGGFRRPTKNESQEEYEERMRRSHEEQLAAQERRKQESITRKNNQAKEREQERLEAEARRKTKTQKKRAQAEAERNVSEERTRVLMKKAQETRSAVFEAARKGNVERVKKGIWEDGVDAAGGEIKPGCMDYIKNNPEDPIETLMHISAINGDLDLIKWLDSHSADPEERNQQGMTAFHLAMTMGHIPIVNYFFEEYPPKHCPSIYEGKNLLTLALQSRSPELVEMVLERRSTTARDINEALTWASTAPGVLTLRGKKTTKDLERAGKIMELLKKYSRLSSSKPEEVTGPEKPRSVTSNAKNHVHRGRGHGTGRGKRQNLGRPSH